MSVSALIVILFLLCAGVLYALSASRQAKTRREEESYFYASNSVELPEPLLSERDGTRYFLQRATELPWSVLRTIIEHTDRKKSLGLRSVKGARVSYDQIVQVNDAALPHVEAWQHSCTDGSPDLRYRHNTKVLLSRRVCIELDSGRPETLEVLLHPNDQDHDLDIRLNLLVGMVHFPLYRKFKVEFDELYPALQNAYAELALIRMNREKVETELRELGIIDPSSSIGFQALSENPKLSVLELQDGKACIRVLEIEERLNKIISSMKTEYSKFAMNKVFKRESPGSERARGQGARGQV